jgi:hypothetical protein
MSALELLEQAARVYQRSVPNADAMLLKISRALTDATYKQAVYAQACGASYAQANGFDTVASMLEEQLFANDRKTSTLMMGLILQGVRRAFSGRELMQLAEFQAKYLLDGNHQWSMQLGVPRRMTSDIVLRKFPGNGTLLQRLREAYRTFDDNRDKFGMSKEQIANAFVDALVTFFDDVRTTSDGLLLLSVTPSGLATMALTTPLQPGDRDMVGKLAEGLKKAKRDVVRDFRNQYGADYREQMLRRNMENFRESPSSMGKQRML